MIVEAMYPITYYLEQWEQIQCREISPRIASKSGLLSRGKVKIYSAEGLEKLATMTVKRSLIYQYDFGIAYPFTGKVYPVFFYQVITAPKRVLAAVHYAFHDRDQINQIKGFETVIHKDALYADMMIKTLKPQTFLKEEVVDNHFNGLIRTTEVDKAYERITDLLKLWYQSMMQDEREMKKEEILKYQGWLKNFKEKFFREDYGFIATKRILGSRWAEEVFQHYLFNHHEKVV